MTDQYDDAAQEWLEREGWGDSQTTDTLATLLRTQVAQALKQRDSEWAESMEDKAQLLRRAVEEIARLRAGVDDLNRRWSAAEQQLAEARGLLEQARTGLHEAIKIPRPFVGSDYITWNDWEAAWQSVDKALDGIRAFLVQSPAAPPPALPLGHVFKPDMAGRCVVRKPHPIFPTRKVRCRFDAAAHSAEP